MTGPDRELVAKKLARIETCVKELRTFASAVRERIGSR